MPISAFVRNVQSCAACHNAMIHSERCIYEPEANMPHRRDTAINLQI